MGGPIDEPYCVTDRWREKKAVEQLLVLVRVYDIIRRQLSGTVFLSSSHFRSQRQLAPLGAAVVHYQDVPCSSRSPRWRST
jgi:hypothetical protein